MGHDRESLVSEAKLCMQAKPSKELVHHVPCRADVQPLAGKQGSITHTGGLGRRTPSPQRFPLPPVGQPSGYC